MAGLAMKEVARIAKHVEAQGVNITRTKSGLLMRMPDGETAMVHFTSSDVNQVRKLRAQLHRSGVSMPNDPRDLEALPAYARGKSSPEYLARVRTVVEELGNPQTVKPGDVVAAYDAKYGTKGTNATVMSAMHNLGYYPHQTPAQAKRGPGAGRTLYKYWERDLTAEELAEQLPELGTITTAELEADTAELTAHVRAGSTSDQVYTLLATTGREWKVAEIREALPGVNESTLSTTLNGLKSRGMIARVAPATYALPEPQAADLEHAARLDPVTPEPEPQAEPEPWPHTPRPEGLPEPQPGMADALRMAPDEPSAREFIDTVDSWPVSLQELDQAATIGQLALLYRASGLAMELRLWRL